MTDPRPRARRRLDVRSLPRGFYDRPVLEVARDLLGMRLVRVLDGRRRLEGRIVEVEAYDGPRDRACHASRGLTRRTEPMFGEAGHAYVYFVYGMHCCLNVVTGPVGYPAAVLLRAVEPIAGEECMNGPPSRTSSRSVPLARIAGGLARIASGPGRLTRAFHVGLDLNRADLCSEGALRIEEGDRIPARMIVRGLRVGVEYAGVWARKPWRLGIRGHPALSRVFERA